MRSYNMPGAAEQSCSCVPEFSYRKSEYVPGMAYVPWQNFTTMYEIDKGLEAGTIFPELDKPFVGRGGMGRV